LIVPEISSQSTHIRFDRNTPCVKKNKIIFDLFENIHYINASLAVLAGQGPILSIFITPLLLSNSQHFLCLGNNGSKALVA